MTGTDKIFKELYPVDKRTPEEKERDAARFEAEWQQRKAERDADIRANGRTVMTYRYRTPEKSTILGLDIDRELEVNISQAAHSCNWHEFHFYRYLLDLGWQAFNKDPKQEDDGFISRRTTFDPNDPGLA